jgi:hypothetical protein
VVSENVTLAVLLSNVQAPCKEGVTNVVDAYGSFSDGYGLIEYAPSRNCTWVINPPDDKLGFNTTVVFTNIHLEEGYDWIYVFEGVGIRQEKLVAAFTGSYPKNGDTDLPVAVSVPGVAGLTVQFISDDSRMDRGFRALFGTPYDRTWLQWLQASYGFSASNPGVSGNAAKLFGFFFQVD